MNKGYQMYVGDGKLTKTNDCNECFVVKIDNPEGASACYYDFLNNGFPEFPDYSDWEEDAFPVIIFFNDDTGDWIPAMYDDRIATLKTILKLVSKL